MQFRYGIEHEMALLRPDGRFADFTNTTFEELDSIIDKLPIDKSDYPSLRVGDLGIKKKRWYIEGFERFGEAGQYHKTDPKGVEIRTTIHDSIQAAVDALLADFEKFKAVSPFLPAAVAFNPFQTEFTPLPPLNQWELAHRSSPEEATAYIHMMTYGPDVSLSSDSLSEAQIVDAGQKLNYYSPYIMAFSLSSPFYKGELWGGLSRRTYYRNGLRPSALVFLKGETGQIESRPSLTQVARLDAEIGRIEFKAFDVCSDLDQYGSLLALVKGVILDDSLTGRSLTPDSKLLKTVAEKGFDEDDIWRGAQQVLQAAHVALPTSEKSWLDRLTDMHSTKRTTAHRLIELYNKYHDISKALEHSYD